MEDSHHHWEKSSKGHVCCGGNVIYAYERLTIITTKSIARADPKDPSPLHRPQHHAPAYLLSLLAWCPLCKILIILTKSLHHLCKKINQSYPMSNKAL